jgi:hypothetical protein
MNLSLLCPSARPKFLDQRLLEQVHSPKWRRQVEFIMLHDNKHISVGRKMKQLLDASTGEFVMFVADDDIASPKLLPLLLNLLDQRRFDGAGYRMRILPQVHGKSMVCTMSPTMKTSNGQIVKGEQFWRWHPILPTHRKLYEDIEYPDASLYEDKDVADQVTAKLVEDRWTFIDDELYFAFPQEGTRWCGQLKSFGGIS